MKLIVIAAIAALLTTDTAIADSRYEAGRKAYAIMQAGAEYCPDIEETWTALAIIREGYGYDPLKADDAEYGRVLLEKQKMFDTFRTSPRVLVCDMLMQEFGPGARVHLFQFR